MALYDVVLLEIQQQLLQHRLMGTRGTDLLLRLLVLTEGVACLMLKGMFGITSEPVSFGPADL